MVVTPVNEAQLSKFARVRGYDRSAEGREFRILASEKDPDMQRLKEVT